MNPLTELIKHGQSYWLDNLTRGKIQSGELKDRVENQGLRGITSNPAIFMKAITQSEDYDEQIRELAGKGRSTQEIYEALTIQDIQNACDILHPVYVKSDGTDGFVSLEVSPHLARKCEETMDEARRLYKKVDRPNCFIKIPGTQEGLPAIEEMLYEGININITLLFSIERYVEVAEAYIRALERRVDEGKSLSDIASVASFFLSRIDVLVDNKLDSILDTESDESIKEIARDIKGETAIASAKIAYQKFQKIFSGERWDRLEKQGAHVQKPLWASTSTKNSDYRDVRYVENLIGENTVNTLPDETIDAFADHGEIRPNSVEEEVDKAYETLEMAEKIEINMEDVTSQLVGEGIRKFISPYEDLLESIEEKSGQLVS